MSFAGLLLATVALLYNPADWHHYPAMNSVQAIAATSNRVYITVPRGVYVFSRYGTEHLTTLTAADGIAGEARFSAWNPARNELLVVAESGLYSFIEEPHRVRPLDPPFTRARSIGVSPSGVWFETEQGLFRRGRPGDEFVPAAELPPELDWHGARDTLNARDFPQLAPFFVTDEQLITRDLHRTRLDPRSRRLYVAAGDYGVLVYNLASWFPERHLRFGPPPGRVRQVTRFEPDGTLWFLAGDHSLVVTPTNEWRYSRTRVADIILPPGLRRLAGVRELISRAGLDLNAVIADSNRFVAATRDGLFLFTGDGEPLRLPTGGREPLALAWSGPDTLLVGTDSGLLLLTDGAIAAVTDPFDRAGFGIYSIAVAEGGTRWLGAFGGILRQSPDGEWEHLIPPGFDLGRPVRALAATDSALFFPTRDGLTVLDLRSGGWENIGLREGLPTTEVTALYADERFLWIAGPGMLSRFDYRNGLPR
ncbi:MAG: hypothetical protein R6X14_04550 [bacterium]